MNISLKKATFVFLSSVLLSGCAGSTLSGQEENRLGEQQAREVLRGIKLSNNPTYKKRLLNAGRRIATVANRPLFKWKYYLVDNEKTANAFVLPGGKVFVYTGLFKYAANESELASVIGHEVAHALKSHGVSSSQRAKTTNILGTVLQVGLLVAGVDASIASIANTLYNTSATYGFIKPNSRSQELEADALGLTLMAKAGYNPKSALSFWDKFGKSGGNRTSEFLSTHPNPGNRIEQLQELMPEALRIYNKKR
jgi:predicted Zn-dependent protease